MWRLVNPCVFECTLNCDDNGTLLSLQGDEYPFNDKGREEDSDDHREGEKSTASAGSGGGTSNGDTLTRTTPAPPHTSRVSALHATALDISTLSTPSSDNNINAHVSRRVSTLCAVAPGYGPTTATVDDDDDSPSSNCYSIRVRRLQDTDAAYTTCTRNGGGDGSRVGRLQMDDAIEAAELEEGKASCCFSRMSHTRDDDGHTANDGDGGDGGERTRVEGGEREQSETHASPPSCCLSRLPLCSLLCSKKQEMEHTSDAYHKLLVQTAQRIVSSHIRKGYILIIIAILINSIWLFALPSINDRVTYVPHTQNRI